MLVVQRRADPQVVAFGRALRFGQNLANPRAGHPGAPHHPGENVGIEHPLNGDSLGGRVEPGYPADALHEGFAVVRSGPSHERAVDIEKNQSGVGQKK